MVKATRCFSCCGFPPSCDTREQLVQVSGGEGKHREICCRELEPYLPGPSLSQSTLPRDGCLLPHVPSPSAGTWSRGGEEPTLFPLHTSITVQIIARTLLWDEAPSLPGCPGTAAPLPRESGTLWTESLWLVVLHGEPQSSGHLHRQPRQAAEQAGFIALPCSLGQDSLSAI